MWVIFLSLILSLFCAIGPAWSGYGINPITGKFDRTGPFVDTGTYAYTSRNIGIGSTSPRSALDVDGGTIYGNAITTTGTAERLSGNTYPNSFIDFNDNAIYIRVDPNIYTTGQISAGINSPTGVYKLAVDGAVYMKPSSLSSAAAGGSRLGINTDGSIYKY